jgi:hypothetical protein
MTTRLSKQQWQDSLSEQEQSGMSVAAFCRDKNLVAKNFYNQRSNKLRKATNSPTLFVRAQRAQPERVNSEISISYGKDRSV